MAKPDTAALKKCLKRMKRKRVSHPNGSGAQVRVEGVSRAFWTYLHKGALYVSQFSSMSSDEIDNVIPINERDMKG